MCGHHFTFWIDLSLRPKTETKRLKFGLSPELRLTNRRSANVIADVIADVAGFFLFTRYLLLLLDYRKSELTFAHQNLMSLTD